MKKMEFLRKFLRSLGYDLVPYPPSDWARAREALLRVLDRLAIDCVLDVGANRGQYGDQLREIGYKGWILSFEPVRASFEVLARHAAASPPWKAFPCALGASDGQAEMQIGESHFLNSFLVPLGPSKTLPMNRAIGTETVELRRLDSIFTECMEGVAARRIYLKLDTQGYDLEVLRGAERVLDHVLGAQTELSFVPIYHGMPNYAESLNEFERRGFGVVDFVPVTRVAGDLLMLEMDCVLARKTESGEDPAGHPAPGSSGAEEAAALNASGHRATDAR
ncbi:MAG: FkbM family methyltransferase [Terracidiphilus sp.]